MIKNWLIRTQNNHILGPVSVSKIKTLLENNSLKDKDELCSGNGYWFSVKEKELLDKYVYQEIAQGYNPVSEAETVLCNSEVDSASLEVPDDITQISLSIESFRKESSRVEGEEEVPEVKSNFSLEDLEENEVEEPINLSSKKKTITNNEEYLTELKSAKFLNSTILYILGVLFLALAGTAFYYRKMLIQNFLN